MSKTDQEPQAGGRGDIVRLAAASSLRSRDPLADVVAGTVVALMLVPQAMAYSVLAGLPPQVGLYASLLPLVIYPLLASSRYLAVGPVAVVSLLVAGAVGSLAHEGLGSPIMLAITLALMVGIFQLALGLLRMGFLVNFLSHAVISGFTAGAALTIGTSQLKHLLGVQVARGETFFDLLRSLVAQFPNTNLVTLAISVSAIVLLIGLPSWIERLGPKLGLPGSVSGLVGKSLPLGVAATSIALVSGLALAEHGVAIVGEIPAGLPALSWPAVDGQILRALLPSALAISFVGFLESYAVAKSLAMQEREKVDANRELVALGAANLGAAFTSGYPVTGGFSRSIVNHAAGARSGLASITTAGFVALSLVFFTPLFFRLPLAVLAAVIVVAVARLVDPQEPFQLFRYCKADAAAYVVSFAAVLLLGLERGVVAGATVALALHLWRTTKPHIAVVGRVAGSEHFRNELRHPVEMPPGVLLIRIDESLYFANASYLEDTLMTAIAEREDIDHVVLIGSAINFIDGSALETLESVIEKLRSAQVTFHLAEIKGPVMDRLQRTSFLQLLEPGRVFLSTHQAVTELRRDSQPEGLSPVVPSHEQGVSSVRGAPPDDPRRPRANSREPPGHHLPLKSRESPS